MVRANRAEYKAREGYQPFPLAALPPVVSDYVEAAASAIDCEPALVAVPALAVAAAAIGNSRAVHLKGGWNEWPILWCLTIAPSGACKSPGFYAAVDPFMDLQMAEVRRAQQRGAEPAYFITSDATIQAVSELLKNSPKGVLLASDEADGWFQSFTRYAGKRGGTDRPHWLQLHQAKTLRVDRIGGGSVSVPRACASVCGTIQPGVFERALDEEAMAAGLGARLLLAMPPSRERHWTETEVDEEQRRRYQDLLDALRRLPLDDPEDRRPHFVRLAPEAKAEWVSWYNDCGRKTYASEGDQAAALSKIEAYAARLALVHHVAALAAEGCFGPFDLTGGSMRAGITLARWFADEALRVYGTLTETATQRRRRELCEWITARGGRTTVRDLQRSNSHRWPDSATAETALDDLARAGRAKWAQIPAPSRGGHPERWLELVLPTPDTSDTRPATRYRASEVSKGSEESDEALVAGL